LSDDALVARVAEHADEKEVELAPGVDSQMLLKRLIESGAAISKFEEVEPSLNDIFIEKVKE
jgi:ABC-2 type transport system ATP-binding protein